VTARAMAWDEMTAVQIGLYPSSSSQNDPAFDRVPALCPVHRQRRRLVPPLCRTLYAVICRDDDDGPRSPSGRGIAVCVYCGRYAFASTTTRVWRSCCDETSFCGAALDSTFFAAMTVSAGCSWTRNGTQTTTWNDPCVCGPSGVAAAFFGESQRLRWSAGRRCVYGVSWAAMRRNVGSRHCRCHRGACPRASASFPFVPRNDDANGRMIASSRTMTRKMTRKRMKRKMRTRKKRRRHWRMWKQSMTLLIECNPFCSAGPSDGDHARD